MWKKPDSARSESQYENWCKWWAPITESGTRAALQLLALVFASLSVRHTPQDPACTPSPGVQPLQMTPVSGFLVFQSNACTWMEVHRDQGSGTEFKHAPHSLHMQLHLLAKALRLGHLRCQYAKWERRPVLMTCAWHARMGLSTHKCLAEFGFFISSGHLTPHRRVQHAPLMHSGSKNAPAS